MPEPMTPLAPPVGAEALARELLAKAEKAKRIVVSGDITLRTHVRDLTVICESVLSLTATVSRLTAALAGQTAELSDAEKLKAHVRGCAECSAGDFCDEGESYGGAVTADYLYRITESNGCRADAAAARVAAYRASRTPTAQPTND